MFYFDQTFKTNTMETSEILLGSDIICEFLGAKLIAPCIWVFPEDAECLFPYGMNGLKYEDLKFHKSFDWIEMVISAICKTGDFRFELRVDKSSVACYILGNTDKWLNFQVSHASSIHHQPPIEVVFNACVYFIEWYNESIKK